MSSKQPHTASASCSSEPLEQGSDGGAGARPPAGAGNASGRQPMVTETAAAISVERVGSAPPDRMRLVFGEHPVQLVSSGRKETYQARYVGTGRTSAMPVVAVFFDDRWAFEKEFEKLELANSLGVGPRVFDVCHREKPQMEDAEGAAFPCLVEEYLGVSLADMIGEDAAAPHIKAVARGCALRPSEATSAGGENRVRHRRRACAAAWPRRVLSGSEAFERVRARVWRRPCRHSRGAYRFRDVGDVELAVELFHACVLWRAMRLGACEGRSGA